MLGKTLQKPFNEDDHPVANSVFFRADRPGRAWSRKLSEAGGPTLRLAIGRPSLGYSRIFQGDSLPRIPNQNHLVPRLPAIAGLSNSRKTTGLARALGMSRLERWIVWTWDLKRPYTLPPAPARPDDYIGYPPYSMPGPNVFPVFSVLGGRF